MIIDSCRVCSKILPSAVALCAHCVEYLLSKDFLLRSQNDLQTFSLLNLNKKSKDLVFKCKNAQDVKLIKELARILALKIQETIVEEIAGVIPIPAKDPLRQDHAFALGFYVAMYLNKSFWPHCLKPLPGGRQKEAKIKARRLVKMMPLEPLPKLSPGVWILIDDVITTGHTLLAAHKALGFPRALSLTLATRPFKI